MGLPLRITFKDNDHVYQILNIKLINQHTIELELVLDGEKVVIEKDSKNRWIQKEGELFDPELIQALGRSVSLRMRMN
jgi:hypothetical protein